MGRHGVNVQRSHRGSVGDALGTVCPHSLRHIQHKHNRAKLTGQAWSRVRYWLSRGSEDWEGNLPLWTSGADLHVLVRVVFRAGPAAESGQQRQRPWVNACYITAIGGAEHR